MICFQDLISVHVLLPKQLTLGCLLRLGKGNLFINMISFKIFWFCYCHRRNTHLSRRLDNEIFFTQCIFYYICSKFLTTLLFFFYIYLLFLYTSKVNNYFRYIEWAGFKRYVLFHPLSYIIADFYFLFFCILFTFV